MGLEGGGDRKVEIGLISYLRAVNRHPSWPRCDLCPDYSNELADVSFGGPRTRTERGSELVGRGLKEGVLRRGTWKKGVVQRAMDILLSRRKRRRAKREIERRKVRGNAHPLYHY